MGKKTFDINLNKTNSIADVIKQLEDYIRQLNVLYKYLKNKGE